MVQAGEIIGHSSFVARPERITGQGALRLSREAVLSGTYEAVHQMMRGPVQNVGTVPYGHTSSSGVIDAETGPSMLVRHPNHHTISGLP